MCEARIFLLYSPNLVEGLFRELRAEGVLGNRSRIARAAVDT